MGHSNISVAVSIIAGAIFPPLCTAIVYLRFYERRKQEAGLGPDDWITIPALVLLIGMSAAALHGIAVKSIGYAAPLSAPTVSERDDPSSVDTARAVLWAVELMYFPALGFVKLSFLFFYRRIFSKGRGIFFRFLTLSVITAVIIWIIGFFFSYLADCKTHIRYNWTSVMESDRYCIDTRKLHLSYSITDFVLDALIIAIPIPLIWQLHMSFARKSAVFAIFALGALSFAASVTRMVEYIQRSRYPNLDVQFVATNAIYWCIIEVGIGLIAACLPSLYGLFKTQAVQSIVKTARNISSRLKSKATCGGVSENQHPFDEIRRTSEPVDSPFGIEIVVQREFELRSDLAKGYSGSRFLYSPNPAELLRSAV